MLFIGGVVSISYRVELFCVPLIFFLLSFIAYVYSLMGCLCQYVTKRGINKWNLGEFCFKRFLTVLFKGRWNCFWKGENMKSFWCIKLRRRLSLLLVLYCFSFCLYVFLSTHTLMCSFEFHEKQVHSVRLNFINHLISFIRC